MSGPTLDALDVSAFTEKARTLGFEVVGAAPVDPLGGGWYAPHAERFEAWIDAGHHGEMHYMAERAGERVVPDRLLPGVKSALVLWLPHRHRPPATPPPEITARVAVYAWGRDYHNIARKALRKLRRWLGEHAPGVGAYLTCDTGPVLERAFGARSAVGWIGKSSMLIHQKLGTFGSLAVVFLDAEVPSAPQAHPDRCGRCTACIDDCPTQAILAPGVVDSTLCIAYWTIEHRGVIPLAIRPLLGDWIFGCDICQDVCPWNNKAPYADEALWRPRSELARPDVLAWLQMPDDDLKALLVGSPLTRPKAVGLKRNILIALANQDCTEALPVVESVLETHLDPVVRATAAWAAHRLGSATALARAARDADPIVRAEALEVPMGASNTHPGDSNEA
ncbi:MAG: tRNA epoxyqueuosine(34) reductase QueG [Bradymonadia bacterium]